jgi:hypothetical protein
VVIAGAGADTVRLGTGNSVIAGDAARLDLSGGTRLRLDARSLAGETGGADTVAVGDGDQWIVGGHGADAIARGDGKAVMLGDLGTIEADADGRPALVATTDPGLGGADVISSGRGDVTAMGGDGADEVLLGAGDHAVIGDMGDLIARDGVRVELRSDVLSPPMGGDDTVTLGAGDSWIIGGEGDDRIDASNGRTIALGDAGEITGDGSGEALRLLSTQNGTGGDDRISTTGGNDILIGGAADDWLSAGGGVDLLSGDGALIWRESTSPSAIVTFESVDIPEGGDDTLIGGAGQDFMFGGIGNDLFDLDLSEDVVVGEFARIRLATDTADSFKATSFISPAVRDLDRLNMATRALNDADRRTEMTKTGFQARGSDLAKLARTRMDVLFGDRIDLRPGAEEEGDGEPMPGLRGFSTLFDASQLVPSNGPAEIDDGAAEGQAPEESGPAPGAGAITEDEAAEADAPEDAGAVEEAAADAPRRGWTIAGWAVRSDAA